MSLLADFDPLTSPSNGSAATAASSSSSSASAASSTSAASTATPPAKFTGVSPEFLISSQWHSLRAQSTHSYALSFLAPTARVVQHEEDAVEKIQREKAEKEKAEDEKAQRERAEEQARNEEAKQAAAAGKEAIGADTKKVELPGQLSSRPASASASSSSAAAAAAAAAAGVVSPTPALDPQIAKAQADLERLSLEQARDLAARNRYAEKATFRYASSEDSKDIDPPVTSQVEYVGVFTITPAKAGAPVSVVLSDVSKSSSQVGKPTVKTDVAGTFTLTVSVDGKKVTGQLETEEISFERFDASSDPDKSLQFLLGY